VKNENDSAWQAPHGAWTILPMRIQSSRRIRSSAKSVLAALAYFARRGSTCWPTHKTLASAAGVSQSTVKRALEQLQVAGLVTWDRRSGRRASLYRLTLPRTHRATNSSISEPQIAQSERQKRSTLPRRRHRRIQSSSRQSAAAEAQRLVAAALTAWSSAPVHPTSEIARKVASLSLDTESVRCYIAERGAELSRRKPTADGYIFPAPGLLAHVVAADYKPRSKS